MCVNITKSYTNNTVRCVDPLGLLTEANRQLVNTDYNSPAFEGTNVTFNCNDPQLLLEGPESIMCMQNGKWEPDPRNVGCTQKGDLFGCMLDNYVGRNFSNLCSPSFYRYYCNFQILWHFH